jgi:hypothetical protein
MHTVRVRNEQVTVGPRFSLAFQRTLRIPDDGGTYPLPPGLGTFPVRRVVDYSDRVPASWREHGGVFIPMYQREALWLSFGGQHWHPCAVKVAVGKVNAVTGQPWADTLSADPQDYVVVPEQPWLDGINAGDGFIRQFVAMPLGMEYTVEGQITGKEEFGGIQVAVFEAKKGRFPVKDPWKGDEYLSRARTAYGDSMVLACAAPAMAGAEMGLAAGGRMEQKIYPDAHGIDTWESAPSGRLYVHIVNSMMYRGITGEEPPATPISVRTYTEYGMPWFSLYDEEKGDVAPSSTLAGVKSVKGMDHAKGFGAQQDDSPVVVSLDQVKQVIVDPSEVPDGTW